MILEIAILIGFCSCLYFFDRFVMRTTKFIKEAKILMALPEGEREK